jgi:hypothetical protein
MRFWVTGSVELLQERTKVARWGREKPSRDMSAFQLTDTRCALFSPLLVISAQFWIRWVQNLPSRLPTV